MKDNYIIIHGSFGSPCGNWYPWLTEKLTNVNKNVIVPQFPIGVGLQNYDNWSKLLDYYNSLGYINDTTTLIGHSSAPIFITKYLLMNNIKVKKLAFVSSFNNYSVDGSDYDKVNSSFFIEGIERLKSLCNDIVCFYSNDDPYVKYDALKDFANKVATKEILIDNGKHLNSESGYDKFEQLLEEIK